jgi:hypothetical protein
MDCPPHLEPMDVIVAPWEGAEYVSAVTREENQHRRLIEATYVQEITDDRIEIDGSVSFTATGHAMRRLRYRQSIAVPAGKVPQLDDPSLCYEPESHRIVSIYEATVGLHGTKILEFEWTADLYRLADLNRDGWVDGADMGLLYSDWGLDVVRSDLNRDGIVDGHDLGVLLVQWDG